MELGSALEICTRASNVGVFIQERTVHLYVGTVGRGIIILTGALNQGHQGPVNIANLWNIAH